VLLKVRVVRYLRVGGVTFGLCRSRRAVIHDVELLCAEWFWWPAFFRSSSWSRNMRISYVAAYPGWFLAGVVLLCLLCRRRWLKRLYAAYCLLKSLCG